MVSCYNFFHTAAKVMQIVLFGFSLLNALAGAAICGLGVFVLVDLSPRGGNVIMIFSKIYGFISSPGLVKSAIFLVIGGLLIMCYGTTSMAALCKKSYKYLCLYIGMLIICIATEATAGVYIVKFQQEVDLVFERFLYWTVRERYVGSWTTKDIFSIGWDLAQTQFSCCGVRNGTDWWLAEKWNRRVDATTANGSVVQVNLTIPATCCKLLDRESLKVDWIQSITSGGIILSATPQIYDQMCLHNPTNHNSFQETGCYDKLSTTILRYNSMILTASITIIFIQVGGVIVTILLHKLLKRAHSDEDDYVPRRRRTSSQKRSSPKEKKKYAYFDDDYDEFETKV